MENESNNKEKEVSAEEEDNEEDFEDFDNEGEEEEEEAREPDLYKILEVEQTASIDEIKNSYKKLIKKYHPDKGGPKNGFKFQEIQEAYIILSDPEKKEIYDRSGMKGILENENNEGGFDPFHEFFGGPKGKMESKMKPIIKEIAINLEDAFKGNTFKCDVQRSVICSDCEGKGGQSSEACSECKGKGIIEKMMTFGPGMYQQVAGPCETCNGQGEVLEEASKCKRCEGKKIVEEKKEIDVIVDPGVPENYEYIFANEGDQYPHTKTGDLIVVIKISPHENFKRQGADLILEKRILLTEALTGFEFDFFHLNGEEILIKTQKNEIIQHGETKLIRNKGMPFFKTPSSFGNLLLKFNVIFPSKNELTADQIGKLKEVLSCLNSSENPNSESTLNQELRTNIEGDDKFHFFEDFQEGETNPNPEGGKVNQEEEEFEDMTHGNPVQCGTH